MVSNDLRTSGSNTGTSCFSSVSFSSWIFGKLFRTISFLGRPFCLGVGLSGLGGGSLMLQVFSCVY